MEHPMIPPPMISAFFTIVDSLQIKFTPDKGDRRDGSKLSDRRAAKESGEGWPEAAQAGARFHDVRELAGDTAGGWKC